MIPVYYGEPELSCLAANFEASWSLGSSIGDATMLFLGVLFFQATFCLIVAEEVCPTGYYTNETTHDCIPCSACEAGEGTAEPCGNRSDTVCKPCSEGHYSIHTSSGRECAGCHSCTPERTELAPCTSTRDSVCGSCSVGYFLYVDHTGSECLRCSKCPPDGEVVRWADCAATGVPEDYRCAPGLWTDDHSTSTTQVPGVVKPTGTIGTEKTKLPTDHGMFVTMKNYDVIDRVPSLNGDTERTIGIVSIVFTVATAFAFFLALGCLFRDQICRHCRRTARKISWSPCRKYFKTNRKLHYPVQVENDSEATEITYPNAVT